MSARFRIRSKEGQELSFASHEVFAEFVRSGDLSPDDVVYDSETREWSPARTHPLVLQIELEAEGAARAGGMGQDGVPAEARSEAPTDIDLDLSPAIAGLTPDEQAAAFVARMEAERASERDPDEDLHAFRMDSSSLAGGFAAAPPSPPPEPPPQPKPKPRRRERPERRESPVSAPTAVPAAPKRKRSSGAVRKHAPFLMLGLVGVAGLVYFGPELLARFRSGGSETESDSASAQPERPPEIASTEEAVRARARERFLTATQAALRGLDQVPPIWLHGEYLAAPSDHAEVRSVWEEYAVTIREVRGADDERYRQAYLRALDDARVVEGGARTLRLSSAVAAFRAAAGRRAAHYDRVESLAMAAIRGHDALVRAEGTIMYQPATGPALSADPVIEAVGRSPEAQTLLNQVLDAILAELHAESGPGEVLNVREWVWTGLLDAVAG